MLNYIIYKWLEHHIIKIKNIKANIIISPESNLILRQLISKKPVFHLKTDIFEYFTNLQKKIFAIEDFYNENGKIKGLNMDLWNKPCQIINNYVYFNNKKKDIFKESLIPRVQL